MDNTHSFSPGRILVVERDPAVARFVEFVLGNWEAFEVATIADPAVALAWLLHNPIVTAPIIGPRTIEQLESTLRATDITLDEGTLKRLDEIFPGPGGEAPVAYSW